VACELPPLPRTLRSLTGLRALAACAVFLRHSGYLFDHTSVRHVTLRLFVQGGVGVSFFFVLSGFVLTWSWRPGLVAFYRRRFARIYPAYIVSTIAAAGLIWLIGGTVSTTGAIAVLFLVQSWFSSPSVFNALDSVSWSLSCEAFFYLLFPALIFAAIRLPVRVRWLAFAAVAFDVIAIPTWVTQPRVWIDYIFPPTRMLEFVCGMLLALEVKSGRWPRVPLVAA
jgi:peptidoglycan/LPS O-acetylase OafA/YrhL